MSRTVNGIELDQFTLGYLTCALWSSCNDQGEPLDGDHDLDDIAPETLKTMVADCQDFQGSFGDLLAQADQSLERSGHDFWLTRNRHGAGFWDRGLGKLGDKLTEMAHPYGSFDLYIGDDGKIHGQ
jgi:hypothetical protein